MRPQDCIASKCQGTARTRRQGTPISNFKTSVNPTVILPGRQFYQTFQFTLAE
jgi:hypothetical protein